MLKVLFFKCGKVAEYLFKKPSIMCSMTHEDNDWDDLTSVHALKTFYCGPKYNTFSRKKKKGKKFRLHLFFFHFQHFALHDRQRTENCA